MINNYLGEVEYQPSHKVHTHPCGNCIYLGDIQAALDL